MLSSADSHARPVAANSGPQLQPLTGDDSSAASAANGLYEQQQQQQQQQPSSSSSSPAPGYAAHTPPSSSHSRGSIRSGKSGKKAKSGGGSPTFTKFLSSLLRKALGGSGSGSSNGSKSSSPLERQADAGVTATAPPAYDHPQRTTSSAAHSTALPQHTSGPPPTTSPEPPLATVSLAHLPISLPALFASAAQTFDTAATRLIACDEPITGNDPSTSTSSDSTRLWHTLALHLRSTFPPTHRHLLQPVLTPVDLVPYLASLLAELALDVCQTLVPGGPLAADQAAALRVLTTLAADAHVADTIRALVDDLLATLAAIHPSPVPVDADDRAALYAACREATRAVAGMRAVHPMLALSAPAAHAPVDEGAASVQWIGMDAGRDVRPGGRKVVCEANLVAYVVFPGVEVPPGMEVEVGDVPRAVVGVYHDPQAYLAGRKRDLYAAAMAAKAAAATANSDKEQASDLEMAMMAHWHHLQIECEDQNELDRQRRRADEELILANAYGAQMTLYMADGIVDG